MKRAIWIVMMMSAAFAVSSVIAVDLSPTGAVADASMEAVSAPPDCGGSWRVVRLHCRGGSQGVAAGDYGGTGFSLACNGDRVTTSICTASSDYGYIMEGERPNGPPIRCFGSGSAVQVNSFCGGLHLTIN